MWPFKKPGPAVSDDLAEARAQRARAEQELESVNERAPRVAAMTTYLAERRAANHFGESIQITFTRRNA